MPLCHRAGARSLAISVSLAALALAPAVAHPQALTLVQSTTRYAGTGVGGYNADFSTAATNVQLNGPSYIVFDSSGNQYISDTQNNCVRMIDTSGGITTLVGLKTSAGDTCSTATNANPTPAEGLYHPTGLAIDTGNNLYISDSEHNCVRVLPSGSLGVANLTTVAGTCGATTTASTTPNPNGLLLDSANHLYISIQDTEASPAASVYQVLRNSAAGLCVIAGATSTQVPTACAGITGSVQLNAPSGLAMDIIGDLFIADTGNNCVRELAGLTTTQTAAGECANDSTGSSLAPLNSPYGLAFSPTQALIITESAINNVVSYNLGSNHLTLIAGVPSKASGTYSKTQDGNSALNATLNAPRGIAVDSTGNTYLADSGNSVTRKQLSNVLFPTTPVGNGAPQPITFIINKNVNLSLTSSPDFTITSNTCKGSLSAASTGAAPATCQVGVSFTPTRPGLRSAALQFTDSISNATILQGLQGTATGSFAALTPGIINTYASSLSAPAAVALDASGNIYILEAGTTVGTADLLMVPAGGGTSQVIIKQGAGLVTPTALAIDSIGNLFIADSAQGTVSRYGADGTVNTLYITGLDTPTSLVVDSFDNLFITEAGATHSVIESYASGLRRTIASSFVSPSGIAMDSSGNLYVSDTGGHYVYAIGATGTPESIVGNGTSTDTNTGQAGGTGLVAPTSVAVDAAGDLYIADSGANLIYTLYASTTSSGGGISAVVGTGVPGDTGDGLAGNLAEINTPTSIALDGSNNLFLIDQGNSALRGLSYPIPTLTFPPTLVNQASAPIQQSITNFGNSDLNLTTAIVITGAQFTLDPSSTTCGNSITKGTTCDIGVIFTPTAPGPVTGSIKVTSNASDSPQIINLIGTGLPIAPPSFTIPAETEVYGQPFPEAVTLPSTGPAPTGTVTFKYGSQVLCTMTGTSAASPLPSTCNAPNSGLSVGTYTVNVIYSGDANYTSSNTPTTLTVTPAPLTLIVNSASRAYNTPNPTLTGTLNGVIPGDTIQVSYSTTATIASPVGTYPIIGTLTVTGPTLLSNYAITNTPGTLTITAQTVTIQVLNESRVYGAANPTFTGTVTGANGNTIQVTYTSTATVTSPVGTYPITATATGADAQDFTPTILPGVLTVTPAPLSVVVANATRNVGDPNPAFSATITGALNGDTFTNSFSTTATTSSPAGTYPINDTVTGANASDYTIIVTPGTLTIDGSTTGTGGGGTGPGGGGTGPGGGGTGTGTTTVNTTTTIATSLTPAPAGTTVTFTAVVSAASGTPTGSVNFLDGTTALGSGTLDSTGTATYSTSALALGSHEITASYQATTSFNASSATLTQVIAAVGSFTVSATPASQFLRGAGTTTYQVTVASVDSFAGQVTLTCSGLPADATCAFGTNPTLTAGSKVTTPLTITTTAADATTTALRIPSALPITVAATIPVELTGLTVLFASIRRRKRLPARARLLVIILGSLFTLALAGCGCPPTVYETYTVTITGASPGATTQTTTVVLSVGSN